MSSNKWLSAKTRNGDYTHAGEEAAIDLVMQDISKSTITKILDVGCGLGGTAKYIQDKGFGQVTGIDFDENMVDYAKVTYPDINFLTCDVVKCDSIFKKDQFDLIYHFNSFYAFNDQVTALNKLNNICVPSGQLIIFDYLALGNYTTENPFSPDKVFNPIRPETIIPMLNQTNWRLSKFTNLNSEYFRWYQNVLAKLKAQQAQLVDEFDLASFKQIENNFVNLLNMFAEDKLGGCVIYAQKIA